MWQIIVKNGGNNVQFKNRGTIYLYENGKIWMIKVHFLAKNKIGLCILFEKVVIKRGSKIHGNIRRFLR
jgi:hypothetical protein